MPVVKKHSRRSPSGKKSHVLLMDIQDRHITELRPKEFQDRLEEIIGIVKNGLDRITKIGNYELNSFQISIGVSAGVIVITLDGGITLNYQIAKNV